MNRRCFSLGAMAALTLAGCETPYGGSPGASSVIMGSEPIAGGDIGNATYRAVDHLLDGAPGLAGSGDAIVVGSIADIRDIDSSSPFGNLVSEMARTRLVQRGLLVTEMRLRSSVHLSPSRGEFTIARDRRAVLPPPRAAHILTGTYTVGLTQLYVSLKLVAVADARILSAADFVVLRYMNTDQLVAS